MPKESLLSRLLYRDRSTEAPKSLMSAGLETLDWADKARDLIQIYGQSILIDYPKIRMYQKGSPLLTVGAYTCYAGVAIDRSSTPYLFHLLEQSAYADLTARLSDSGIGGIYGRLPSSLESRKVKTNFDKLGFTKVCDDSDPNVGFNIMIDESGGIFHTTGYISIMSIV